MTIVPHRTSDVGQANIPISLFPGLVAISWLLHLLAAGSLPPTVVSMNTRLCSGKYVWDKKKQADPAAGLPDSTAAPCFMSSPRPFSVLLGIPAALQEVLVGYIYCGNFHDCNKTRQAEPMVLQISENSN